MTAATDAAAGVWEADGALAAFPPPLQDAARFRPPRPAAVRPPAPVVAEPDVSADPPVRPPSRLADLFAEEEREEAAADETAEPNREPERVPVRVRFAEVDREDEPADDVESPPSVEAPPVWLGVARGVAAALAAACLAEAFGDVTTGVAPPLGPLPDSAATPLLAFCGAGCGVFAVRGCLPAVPRLAATAAAGLLAAASSFAAVRSAGLAPAAAWQTAVCAATVAAAVRLAPAVAAPAGWSGRIAFAAGLAACALGFPLAGGAVSETPPADRTPAAVAGAVGGWWADAVRR